MAKVSHPIYGYRINDYSSPSGWGTNSLFDISYSESNQSPINTFNDKLKELSILILDGKDLPSKIAVLLTNGVITQAAYNEILAIIRDTSNISPVMANLILLGYISAVESYLREIIRRLISLDSNARKSCEQRVIAFGAALYHSKEMLPEALLERISFISADTIKETLKDFLGIKNVPFSSTIISVLQEFEAVCQIRHCVVHRFGKLGANNAIHLGLDSHGKYIEKPIKLNYSSLQTVGTVCANVVKELNQFIWEYVMMRLIAETNNGRDWRKINEPIIWTWDYRKDKNTFSQYYDTFALIGSSAHAVDKFTAYEEYRNKYKALP